MTAALRLVAVTGTNGKTTTTSMIAAIVAAAGEPAARVTTLGAFAGDRLLVPGTDAEAFPAALAWARAEGARTLAVETTSRALGRGFSREWPFGVGVFTNLSRDHLDYHATPEAYLAAKAQLFASLAPGAWAVLNAGDPASDLLALVLSPGVRVSRYCVAPAPPRDVDLAARGVLVTWEGTRVLLEPGPFADALGGEILLGVVGRVHAENALAAALAARALGYDAAAIRAGLLAFGGVPGRFEVVWRRPRVVVDYAHTPDALQRTLAQARTLAAGGRVHVVFGCGGSRDAGKRPEMGRVAALGADVVWITTDNPRDEDPADIAAQVASGARAEEGRPGAARTLLCLDRRAALQRAIAEAQGDDVVVVAGRGHESVQDLGAERVLFSDADVARAACLDWTEGDRDEHRS